MVPLKVICWVGQVVIASVLWFEYGVGAWFCGFGGAMLACLYTAIKYDEREATR